MQLSIEPLNNIDVFVFPDGNNDNIIRGGHGSVPTIDWSTRSMFGEA